VAWTELLRRRSPAARARAAQQPASKFSVARPCHRRRHESMSLDAQRVPAWRRLGLSLRNQDPASAAPPSVPPPACDDAPATTCDRHTSPVERAADSTSSRLGKRKHHAEPREDARHAAKKSKTGPTHGESPRAPTSHAPTSPHAAESTDDALAEHATTSSAVRPKGDANYRKKKKKKKKEKVPKRRREKASAPPAAASPSEAVPPIGLTCTSPPAPRPSKKDNRRHNHDAASPSQTDRRKSVAFTPDTKTSDGNSGQELFKKWVAEQKGTGQVSAPPAVSNFTLHSLIAAEEKAARQNGQLDRQAGAQEPSTALEPTEQKRNPARDEPSATSRPVPSSAPSTSTTGGKKKDPAVYIAYLTQYYTDRNHWKFNKAKQNDVVDNALSIFRIPHEHTEALSEYMAGLQGAGVIERLRERCEATLKELDEQDRKKPMDDMQARKVAEQEAEHERIMQEQKRRRTEGDVERFMHHPHGEG